MKRTRFVPIAIVSLLFMFGCSSSTRVTNPVNPGAAEQETVLGDQALAGGDYTAANTHYKAALAIDSSHPRANLGAAVTEVYLVQNDPEVAALIARLQALTAAPASLRTGPPALGRPGARITSRLGLVSGRLYDPSSIGRMLGVLVLQGTADPPLLSEVQSVIKRKLIPRVQYAEDRLNQVETDPNFVMRLPPSITDEPDTVEVDLGEVRVLDAVVNEVQGWLGIVVAYNFDVPNPVDLVPPDSLLGPLTNFGKLNTDGAAALSQARVDFLQAHTEFNAGVATIGGETDDQSDDVIPQAALLEPEFVDFRTTFDQVDASLNAPVDVLVRDYLGVTRTIQVQLKNFFTNPIADWKTKLPDHDFDTTTGDPYILDPITFPDPIFNGVFPNMTNATWQSLIGPVGPPSPALRVARR